jgi:glycerol-3-phosphate dehydrogenase
VHLVTPAATRHAVVLFAESDNRLFFVVPWLGLSLVGTTDTDFTGDPRQARATTEDIDYLVAAVDQAFPDAPWRQIYFTTAGVRALVRRDGMAAGAVSRKHRLVDHAARGAPGLVSIVGGKLTAYRGIAEEAVDAACRRLAIVAPSRSRDVPLPGAAGYGPETLAAARRQGDEMGLADGLAEHLVTTYGARYTAILRLIAAQPRLAERLDPAEHDCLAQLHHAVEREAARTLSDVFLRRLSLGFTANQGLPAVDRAAAELASLLGWDAERTAAEVADYRATIARMREPARAAMAAE